MALHATKQCYSCKKIFKRQELTDYAGPNGKVLYSYCPKCLAEKQSRDKFSIKVCQIFSLKAPGSRIWAERKRLKDQYGYSDDIIIDCLDYIYNVEKKKKLSESLCLINPNSIDKMKKWKAAEQSQANSIVAAYQLEIKEYKVPIKENTTSNKTNWNPDDWLED